jgi:hypothetical protein
VVTRQPQPWPERFARDPQRLARFLHELDAADEFTAHRMLRDFEREFARELIKERSERVKRTDETASTVFGTDSQVGSGAGLSTDSA